MVTGATGNPSPAWNAAGSAPEFPCDVGGALTNVGRADNRPADAA